MDDFWTAIDEQCAAMRTAKTVDEVIALLNRHGPPSPGDAFFGGGDTRYPWPS